MTNKKYSFQKSQSFETGISDHHHLIYTMLKATFSYLPPKKVVYRSYKTFSEKAFTEDLIHYVGNSASANFSSLREAFVHTVNKHAPYKTRVVRGNNKPHMNKQLRKAIMRRSQLKNKYNKTRDPATYILYKKQRNYVVKLNKQAKRSLFSAKNTDRKSFWCLTKPFISMKGCTKDEKIFLLEGDKIVSNDKDIVNCFNDYFVNITEELPIVSWKPLSSDTDSTNLDSIDKILKKFKDHPSVIRICAKNIHSDKFSFSHINPLDTFQVIMSLNQKKSTSGPLSTKILKIAAKVVCTPLTDCFNVALLDGVFPDELKLASVVPVFKKGDSLNKSNYRPISILPPLSKVFERLLFNQMSVFFERVLSRFLCGFRKNYSTQHALLNLLKHWQNSLDNSCVVGTVLMDLSKAFDSLPHDLLLAKLSAYGFDKCSLRLLQSYLCNRMQRVKIGAFFSDWLELLLGVPQGSILGPLLFNIFINDLLLCIEKAHICNFADDNTLYSSASCTKEVISSLTHDLSHVLSWFTANQLVANPHKFQMMLLGTNDTSITINVNGFTINQSDYVKLLGVTLDKNLSGQKHVGEICARAGRGVMCLRRIRKYLDFKQALSLYHCYIQSHFSYCTLIWMFCNKTTYKSIEKVQKRALRALYNVYDLPLDALLEIDDFPQIHVLNIRCLLIEIYKTLHGLNPSFMEDIFVPKSVPYSLRDTDLLTIPKSNTVRYGVNSLTFRSSILWNNLPSFHKQSKTLHAFKDSIKTCSAFECTCILCKNKFS